jgi:Iodothyronine deiodinase
MSSYPRRYNYPHFRFSHEEAELEFWSANAPALGSSAPDFALPSLDGRPWWLGDHLGRPVVLEFGSYTCPIFCGRVGRMEQLRDEFPEVAFAIAYVREAHPGEVTPPHESIERKTALARAVIAAEGIRRTVLVDSTDGDVHLLYGGGYNSIFVLDAQGHVVVRRFWNEPSDVRVALLQMRSNRRPIPVESVRLGVPSDRPPVGLEMLERGGREAVRDFAREAPARILRQLDRSGDEVRAIVASVEADAS